MNNTLKYVKILEGTGVTREQAEAHVQLITEIMEDDLATKQDIKNLEVATQASIKDLEVATQASVKNLEVATRTSIKELEQSVALLNNKVDALAERFDHKMLQMEYRMTIKLGTIVTVAMAAATTAMKLL